MTKETTKELAIHTYNLTLSKADKKAAAAVSTLETYFSYKDVPARHPSRTLFTTSMQGVITMVCEQNHRVPECDTSGRLKTPQTKEEKQRAEAVSFLSSLTYNLAEISSFAHTVIMTPQKYPKNTLLEFSVIGGRPERVNRFVVEIIPRRRAPKNPKYSRTLRLKLKANPAVMTHLNTFERLHGLTASSPSTANAYRDAFAHLANAAARAYGGGPFSGYQIDQGKMTASALSEMKNGKRQFEFITCGKEVTESVRCVVTVEIGDETVPVSPGILQNKAPRVVVPRKKPAPGEVLNRNNTLLSISSWSAYKAAGNYIKAQQDAVQELVEAAASMNGEIYENQAEVATTLVHMHTAKYAAIIFSQVSLYARELINLETSHIETIALNVHNGQFLVKMKTFAEVENGQKYMQPRLISISFTPGNIYLDANGEYEPGMSSEQLNKRTDARDFLRENL